MLPVALWLLCRGAIVPVAVVLAAVVLTAAALAAAAPLLFALAPPLVRLLHPLDDGRHGHRGLPGAGHRGGHGWLRLGAVLAVNLDGDGHGGGGGRVVFVEAGGGEGDVGGQRRRVDRDDVRSDDRALIPPVGGVEEDRDEDAPGGVELTILYG